MQRQVEGVVALPRQPQRGLVLADHGKGDPAAGAADHLKDGWVACLPDEDVGGVLNQPPPRIEEQPAAVVPDLQVVAQALAAAAVPQPQCLHGSRGDVGSAQQCADEANGGVALQEQAHVLVWRFGIDFLNQLLGQRSGVCRLGGERVENLLRRRVVGAVKGVGGAASGLFLGDSPSRVLNEVQLVEKRLAALNVALAPVGAALRTGPIDGEAEAGGGPGFA